MGGACSNERNKASQPSLYDTDAAVQQTTQAQDLMKSKSKKNLEAEPQAQTLDEEKPVKIPSKEQGREEEAGNGFAEISPQTIEAAAADEPTKAAELVESQPDEPVNANLQEEHSEVKNVQVGDTPKNATEELDQQGDGHEAKDEPVSDTTKNGTEEVDQQDGEQAKTTHVGDTPKNATEELDQQGSGDEVKEDHVGTDTKTETEEPDHQDESHEVKKDDVAEREGEPVKTDSPDEAIPDKVNKDGVKEDGHQEDAIQGA